MMHVKKIDDDNMPILLFRLTEIPIPRKPTYIYCTNPKYISQLPYSSSQSTLACRIVILLPIVMNNAYRVNDAFHFKNMIQPNKNKSTIQNDNYYVSNIL